MQNKGKQWESFGQEESLANILCVLVHRGRKDQRPRAHGQVSVKPPGCLPEGCQAQRDPPCAFSVCVG